MNHITDKKSQC
uniref:Uncharacterized protein n=1 Tax=Anguilla anguilla TaxID=7936 RepID=A0A0E9RRW5_ANGAN